MRGAAIGGHVAGEPLSSPKFDPFWGKAEQLGALVFMHPGSAENVVKEDGLKGMATSPTSSAIRWRRPYFFPTSFMTGSSIASLD